MLKCTRSFLFFTLLTVVSCSRPVQEPQLLVEADSAYMHGSYDEGDSLLSLYLAQVDKSNDEAIIRYQELVELEQSFFNNTISDKNQRQAENLCRYYENRNIHHHSKALLLLSEVFLKSGDYPSALNVLLEAQDLAYQKGDVYLQCLISRARGDVYFLQQMYDDCIPCYEDYYRLAKANRDTLRMARAAHCMARVCIINQQVDSCIAYFKEAISLGERAIHQGGIVPQSKNWLADIYIQIEEYDSARMYLTHEGVDDANWGNLYLAENKIDSAAYYFRKTLGRYKWLGETNVLHKLALLERYRGNMKAALDYYEQLSAAKDSLMVMTKDEQTKQTEARFNLTSVKRELEESEHERIRMRWLIAGLVVAVLLVALTAFVFWRLHKRNENNEKMHSLLLEKDRENYELRQDNDNYQEERRRRIAQIQSSELYKRLTSPVTANDKKLSIEEWTELARLLDSAYNGFTHNLTSRHTLSDTELRICYLVKLGGLSNTQIADILSRSPSAVTKSRQRMNKKLTGRDGTSDDFNDFIERL